MGKLLLKAAVAGVTAVIKSDLFNLKFRSSLRCFMYLPNPETDPQTARRQSGGASVTLRRQQIPWLLRNFLVAPVFGNNRPCQPVPKNSNVLPNGAES